MRRPTLIMLTRYPLDHPGGIEKVASLLCRHLPTGDFLWSIKHYAGFARRTPLAAIPILGDLIATFRLGLSARADGDVIMVHGPEYVAGPLIVGRLKKRPVIVVWHGVRGSEAVPPAVGIVARLALTTFLKASDLLQRLALHASLTVAVSPTVESDIRLRFGFTGRITVIINGIAIPPNTCADARSDGERQAAHGGQPPPPSRPLRLIWIGTTPYKKGLDLALAACREARLRGVDLRLTVVGLTSRASPFDLRPDEAWVQWQGLQPPDQVQNLLRSHDVLLFPSRYEACSMTILQALTSGVPILASAAVQWQVDGAAEVVGTELPSDYADALERLQDETYRHHLAREGITRVIAFSLDDSLSDYRTMLAQTLAGSSGATPENFL